MSNGWKSRAGALFERNRRRGLLDQRLAVADDPELGEIAPLRRPAAGRHAALARLQQIARFVLGKTLADGEQGFVAMAERDLDAVALFQVGGRDIGDGRR